MLSSYKILDEFNDFVSYNQKELSDEEVECQNRKVAEIARIMIASIDKHFSRWVNGHLLKLSLFGESETAQAVANYILGQERTLGEETSTNFSEIH